MCEVFYIMYTYLWFFNLFYVASNMCFHWKYITEGNILQRLLGTHLLCCCSPCKCAQGVATTSKMINIITRKAQNLLEKQAMNSSGFCTPGRVCCSQPILLVLKRRPWNAMGSPGIDEWISTADTSAESVASLWFGLLIQCFQCGCKKHLDFSKVVWNLFTWWGLSISLN
jgi:hypothetical protein